MNYYKSPSYTQESATSFTQQLVEQYAPITLFVNRDLDILYTNGSIEQFLRIPKALARFNIGKMINREGAIIFKNCIQRTLELNKSTLYKDYPLPNKQGRYANFYFQNFDLKNPDQNIVIVRVHLHDKPAQDDQFEDIDNSTSINKDVKKLEQKIRASEKETQSLVSELEATSEELKTANRELLASNEELISTNEELQSVNEELHTVNNELQIKNEELNITRNDIHNLLRSTNIGTLFLDTKWKIKKFNDAIKQHFNLKESDVQRSITDFESKFQDLELIEIAKEVYETLNPYEKEIKNKKGEFFLLRVFPYRTNEDQIKGVVVNFLDVDALTKARLKWRKLAETFKCVFSNTTDIVLSLEEDGTVKNINRSLGKYGKEEIIGKKIAAVLPKKESQKIERVLKRLEEKDEVQRISITLSSPKKGERIYYEMTLIPVVGNASNATKVLIVVQDRTKSKERLKSLEHSFETYKSFMDNARHQIILLDEDQKILYINHTFDEKKGKQDLIGEEVTALFPKKAAETYLTYLDSILEEKAATDKLVLNFTDRANKKREIKYVGFPVFIQGKINCVATVSDFYVEEE